MPLKNKMLRWNYKLLIYRDNLQWVSKKQEFVDNQ